MDFLLMVECPNGSSWIRLDPLYLNVFGLPGPVRWVSCRETRGSAQDTQYRAFPHISLSPTSSCLFHLLNPYINFPYTFVGCTSLCVYVDVASYRWLVEFLTCKRAKGKANVYSRRVGMNITLVKIRKKREVRVCIIVRLYHKVNSKILSGYGCSTMKGSQMRRGCVW